MRTYSICFSDHLGDLVVTEAGSASRLPDSVPDVVLEAIDAWLDHAVEHHDPDAGWARSSDRWWFVYEGRRIEDTLNRLAPGDTSYVVDLWPGITTLTLRSAGVHDPLLVEAGAALDEEDLRLTAVLRQRLTTWQEHFSRHFHPREGWADGTREWYQHEAQRLLDLIQSELGAVYRVRLELTA